MWQVSFLRQLTSFVYCLLSFVLRLRVYCLPSALFCLMWALLWIYQLRSRAHHHHKATATPNGRGYLQGQYFTAKFTAVMTSQFFIHVLGFWSLRLRLCKLNTWLQKTNSSDQYAPGLFFMSFDVRILFCYIWNLTSNNLSRMSKNLMPKTRRYKYIYL